MKIRARPKMRKMRKALLKKTQEKIEESLRKIKKAEEEDEENGDDGVNQALAPQMQAQALRAFPGDLPLPSMDECRLNRLYWRYDCENIKPDTVLYFEFKRLKQALKDRMDPNLLGTDYTKSTEDSRLSKLKHGLIGLANGSKTTALADTGSRENVVSESYTKKLHLTPKGSPSTFEIGSSRKLQSIGRSRICDL